MIKLATEHAFNVCDGQVVFVTGDSDFIIECNGSHAQGHDVFLVWSGSDPPPRPISSPFMLINDLLINDLLPLPDRRRDRSLK
jgi:hypothetical protein